MRKTEYVSSLIMSNVNSELATTLVLDGKQIGVSERKKKTHICHG